MAERVEVLEERLTLIDGGDVGERERVQLGGAVVLEDALLELLELVVVMRLDLGLALRLARLIVDLERAVELERAKELAKQTILVVVVLVVVAACQRLAQRAVNEHVGVGEQGVEEASRGQQRLEVDEQLEAVLEIGELDALERRLVLVLLELSEREQELVDDERAQEASLEASSLERLGCHARIVLLQRLPELAQLGVLGELVLALVGAQRVPHGQTAYLLHLHAHHVHLEAVNAVVEELDEHGLLLAVARHFVAHAALLVALQARAQHVVEEGGELSRLRAKAVPSEHSLAELLVHHDHDGHEVSARRRRALVVRPQVALQVLAELEQHDASQREVRARQLVLVDVVDELRRVGLKRSSTWRFSVCQLLLLVW